MIVMEGLNASILIFKTPRSVLHFEALTLPAKVDPRFTNFFSKKFEVCINLQVNIRKSYPFLLGVKI